jgi:hypothetical protein
MTRGTFCLILLVSLAAPVLSQQHVSADEPSQTYIDNTYKVTLRFPRDWKRDPSYHDRPYSGVEKQRYSAAHGFFQLLATGDEDPKQACKGAAEHVVRPFGSHPTTRPMKVDGQNGCLVWPSEDQGAPWDAALFIKSPEPVEIDGDRYSTLEVDADKSYILAIARSLRFISSTRRNPPFLLEISNAKPAGIWKADAPLLLLVTMKNTSEPALRFALGDPAVSYRTMVTRYGELSRVTENLPEGNEEPRGASPCRRAGITTLKPNEACRDAIEIRFFSEVQTPGEYSLQVERDLPSELGEGIAVSNTITLKVAN